MLRRLNTVTTLKRRFRKDQAGTSSIEFILIFPLFFMMFALSLESGFLTTQKIFLERGFDIATRKLSLETAWDTMTGDIIQQRVCSEGVLKGCEERLTVQIYRVDPADGTFSLPGKRSCLDRSDDKEEDDPTKPTNEYDGTGVTYEESMFIGVCLLVDPMFSATPLTPSLNRNSSGGYYLYTVGMFTIEPEPSDDGS